MNRRIRATFAGTVMAVALVVAGCATDKAALDPQTSQQWQSQVVTIAETAGAGDYATALESLAALEAEATRARQDGEISAERAAIIQQSIAAVRSDLEAASTDPVAPAPEDTAVTDSPATDPVEDDSSTEDENNRGNKDENKGNKDENKNKGNKDEKSNNGNKKDKSNNGNKKDKGDNNGKGNGADR